MPEREEVKSYIRKDKHRLKPRYSNSVGQITKLTKDICRPYKSTGSNIRGNPSTAEDSSRIIHYSINPSQLLKQEKCCPNTDNCGKTWMSREESHKKHRITSNRSNTKTLHTNKMRRNALECMCKEYNTCKEIKVNVANCMNDQSFHMKTLQTGTRAVYIGLQKHCWFASNSYGLKSNFHYSYCCAQVKSIHPILLGESIFSPCMSMVNIINYFKKYMHLCFCLFSLHLVN